MAALALLLLLDGTSTLRDLADPALAVRERAVEELARGNAATADLVPHLLAEDPRVAAGVAEALERRGDPAALEGLLACAALEDGARAAVAARAAVRLAFATLEPLPAGASPLLDRRLADAVDAEVRARLGALPGLGSHDNPGAYRGLLAGEAHAAVALRRLMADGGARPGARAHACRAAVRLLGADAAPDYVRLLGDAEPHVRAAAADCIDETDDLLAAMKLTLVLDRGREIPESVALFAARAASKTGVLSEAGAEHLGQIVAQGGDAHDAVTAARALHANDPERCRSSVRARIRAYLQSDAVAPGAAAPASLFLLADLPVGEEERAALRASPDPLVRAPAEEDPAKALEVLRPVIAPERPMGAREFLRIQIVGALLRRCDAPAADRVAFAAMALETDNASSRWEGLRVLPGLPADALEPLVPRLLLALGDTSEMVRVAAAGLLAPREPALRVLALAVHDGRPWQVRRAGEALARAGHGDAGATPAERRAFARDLLRRIGGGARDKE